MASSGKAPSCAGTARTGSHPRKGARAPNPPPRVVPLTKDAGRPSPESMTAYSPKWVKPHSPFWVNPIYLKQVRLA